MKRFWLGRSSSAEDPWRGAVTNAGWETAELPLIHAEPLRPTKLGYASLGSVEEYTWVLAVSQHAVTRLFEERSAVDRPGWPEQGPKVGATGPATAATWREHGVEVDLIAPDATGRSLAEAVLETEPARDGRILVVAAAGGRPEPQLSLEMAGLGVDRIELHRSVALEGERPTEEEPVLLFSPSAARAFRVRILFPDQHPVWAVGPATAATAAKLGLRLERTLDRPEPEALTEALADHPSDG